MTQPQTQKISGVVGFFDQPKSLMKGTEKVREANYQYFDTFTPFPIHGLEQAQGLKRSPLPYVTFAAGLTGCLLGFSYQYWTSAVDWPLNVGGKPFNSWPAFVPVMFELTVLFAALATVGAMFLMNGLPNMRRKAIDPSLTRDRFAIFIESPPAVDEDDEDEVEKAAKYKSFNESEVTSLLKEAGATEVRSVYAEGWF